MLVCVCVCVFVCARVCMHMYVRACVCVRVCVLQAFVKDVHSDMFTFGVPQMCHWSCLKATHVFLVHVAYGIATFSAAPRQFVRMRWLRRALSRVWYIVKASFDPCLETFGSVCTAFVILFGGCSTFRECF